MNTTAQKVYMQTLNDAHMPLLQGVLTVKIIRCINLKGERPTSFVKVILKPPEGNLKAMKEQAGDETMAGRVYAPTSSMNQSVHAWQGLSQRRLSMLTLPT